MRRRPGQSRSTQPEPAQRTVRCTRPRPWDKQVRGFDSAVRNQSKYRNICRAGAAWTGRGRACTCTKGRGVQCKAHSSAVPQRTSSSTWHVSARKEKSNPAFPGQAVLDPRFFAFDFAAQQCGTSGALRKLLSR
eukprot:2726588-Rhodomonas_salina.1